jgi:hypothetical protein
MGGDVNTHVRRSREVVLVTSGVRFLSRECVADGTCANAAIDECVGLGA